MAKEEIEIKIDKELEISIPLENFEYSGSKSDTDQNRNSSRFFGREREKKHLLDRLIQGKEQGGSFLVAGYRGVGKTRFVTQVLSNYAVRKKFLFFKWKKRNFIKVQINLGNDGDLRSTTVLFNMVYLLNNELRKKKIVRLLRFFFGNFIRSFAIVIAFVFFPFFVLPDSYSVLANFHSIEDFLRYKHLSFSCLITGVAFWILAHYGKFPFSCFATWKAFVKLRDLQKKIYSTTDSYAQIKSSYFDFGKKRIASPLTPNQIEVRLRDIIGILKKHDVIFIFDELDKLSGRASDIKTTDIDLIKEAKLRKLQVDAVLGDLKNLITSSDAKYIFIAGRDMYDAYLSERGSSNSLYESLFNDHIYIPSLLTDRSDGEHYLLDSMIEAFVVSNLIPSESIEDILEKKAERDITDVESACDFSSLRLSDYVEFEENEIENEVCSDYPGPYLTTQRAEVIKSKTEKLHKEKLHKEIYILKTLIHFLALHSWGNCKRLFTLFELFVRKEKGKYQLHFSTRDIQRLVLSSQLYILFHHNLSRMLMNADDKLVVSSFSVFHYILKYHGIGFSREHILRMYETINIHSSPELVRIVDIIVHNVLLNHVRRVRNGFYQYRFTFLHEKEIHFITTISDGESAAFNFSLNAMDAVKQHYKNLIMESKQTHEDNKYGHGSLASIHVIVGNFHFWEQSFDEAAIHYGIALDMLKEKLNKAHDPKNLELYIQLIEVYLKQGAAEERVINYAAATAAYLNAQFLANECSQILGKLNPEFNSYNPKWEILNQPKWAKLFLNLKLSNRYSGYKPETDAVSQYKQAVLAFFMEDYRAAYEGFRKTIDHCGDSGEQALSLKGNSYLRAAFCLLLDFSSTLHHEIKHKENNPQIQFIDRDKEIIHEEWVFLKDKLKEIGNTVLIELITQLEKIDAINFSNVIGEYSKIQKSEKIMQTIKLLNLSAQSFEKGKLYSNTATSYLSMIMVWEMFLEMLPWKKHDDDNWNEILYSSNYDGVQNTIHNFRNNENNWVFVALQKAFESIGKNTGDAYHHSMKSVLERNLRKKNSDELFFNTAIHRKKILENNEWLFQHYSHMGQVIAASIF